MTVSKILLVSLFIVSFFHISQAQEVKTVKKAKELVKEQTFYLTTTSSRTYIPVNVPENTVEWYIAFTSTADGSPSPINLLSQVTNLVDPSGITSSVADALTAPNGTAMCNVLLTDLEERKKFMNFEEYTYYSNQSRKNFTHGVITVGENFKGPYQILLYNPSYTTSVRVSVEVTAIVEEEEVNMDVWSPDIKDMLYTAYDSALIAGSVDSVAAHALANCVVENICQQKTPAQVAAMPEFELTALETSIAENCQKNLQGVPQSENYDKAVNYGNLAWKSYENGDVDKCIEYSKKALELDNNLGWVKANLGLCYLIKGDESTAMDYYMDAITIMKKDKLNAKQYLESALSDINDALKKYPDMKGYKAIQDLLKQELKAYN